MTALANGNYVVCSPDRDNGVIVNAGAVTWGDGNIVTSGPITAENSLRGTAAYGGYGMNFNYDVNQQLVVRRPYDNIVTLVSPQPPTPGGRRRQPVRQEELKCHVG